MKFAIMLLATLVVLATAAPAFAQRDGDQPKPQFVLYLGDRTDVVHTELSRDRISRQGFVPFVLYMGEIRTPRLLVTTADNIR